MARYIVTIRNPQLEEYDAGTTLEEARKEAAFFVKNTPSTVPVKICTYDFSDKRYPDGRIIVKEVVRE